MAHVEKRKFIRLDSLHLLDYTVLDKDRSKGRYSMGRTLDVSVNGIKMETTDSLNVEDTLEITIGIEEDLIDLEGRITYSNADGARFVSGIEFVKMSGEGRRIFRRYTEAFKQLNKSSRLNH
ncbi:MAG: PilZ domain-containing protein [Desulfofustis sp.]|nr:PilZ domain-containing protein [Desulfofustis sp.]